MCLLTYSYMTLVVLYFYWFHLAFVPCKYTDDSSSAIASEAKGFLIHKCYLPCVPGDRRETEENVDDN